MPRLSSARQTPAESDSLPPSLGTLPLTEKSSGGGEHGRSVAGMGLVAIVLALGAFYAWLAMPQKLPAVGEGKTLTSYDSFLGIAAPAERKLCVVGEFGMILSSSDGGKTWQRQASATSRTLTSVSYADSLHGFAAGNGGLVLATRDGGSTWQKQHSGVSAQLLAVAAASPTDVFAVGAYGTLLTTSDGGANWSKVALPWNTLIPKVLKDNPGVEPNLNNVFFLDRNTGWIVGEFGIILKTADGGRTWTAQRAGEDLPQLYAIVFTDPATGWAVGQVGSLIHTTDGGATFSAIQATPEDLFSIAIAGLNGVVVGNHTLLMTHDGGRNWLAGTRLPGGIWLNQVVLDSARAIAVGAGGTILSLNLHQ